MKHLQYKVPSKPKKVKEPKIDREDFKAYLLTWQCMRGLYEEDPEQFERIVDWQLLECD